MRRWLREELPDSITAAKELSHAELSRVMRWKLARGKWRPLQRRVDANSPASVSAASKAAFAFADKGHWRGALKKLCVLGGISHGRNCCRCPSALTIYPLSFQPNYSVCWVGFGFELGLGPGGRSTVG